MLKYHSKLIVFLSTRTVFSPKEQFSEVGDRMGYCGFVPSEGYLRDVYNKFMEARRDLYDKEMMKISGNILKGDHSFKLAKRIVSVEHQHVFDAVYSVTNELGQIRGQYLTSSKSHSQIEPGLVGIGEGLRKMGYQQPKLYFTDDADRTRAFWNRCFHRFWKMLL